MQHLWKGKTEIERGPSGDEWVLLMIFQVFPVYLWITSLFLNFLNAQDGFLIAYLPRRPFGEGTRPENSKLVWKVHVSLCIPNLTSTVKNTKIHSEINMNLRMKRKINAFVNQAIVTWGFYLRLAIDLVDVFHISAKLTKCEKQPALKAET